MKKYRVLIGAFALWLTSLACMGTFFEPVGYSAVEATQQAAGSAQLYMQMTQAAADAGYTNAQSTAVINNSSDSPQGGVNIYLQGHKDGYNEGAEDVSTNITIKRQANSLQFWQIIAGGLLCIGLGMVFLNAMSHR